MTRKKANLCSATRGITGKEAKRMPFQVERQGNETKFRCTRNDKEEGKTVFRYTRNDRENEIVSCDTMNDRRGGPVV